MYDSAQNMAGERRIKGVHNQASMLAYFERSIYSRRIDMIKSIFARLLATMFLVGVFGALSGCNTMEGAGRDIQQGGKAISGEAAEHKNY